MNEPRPGSQRWGGPIRSIVVAGLVVAALVASCTAAGGAQRSRAPADGKSSVENGTPNRRGTLVLVRVPDELRHSGKVDWASVEGHLLSLFPGAAEVGIEVPGYPRAGYAAGRAPGHPQVILAFAERPWISAATRVIGLVTLAVPSAVAYLAWWVEDWNSGERDRRSARDFLHQWSDGEFRATCLADAVCIEKGEAALMAADMLRYDGDLVSVSLLTDDGMLESAHRCDLERTEIAEFDSHLWMCAPLRDFYAVAVAAPYKTTPIRPPREVFISDGTALVVRESDGMINFQTVEGNDAISDLMLAITRIASGPPNAPFAPLLRLDEALVQWVRRQLEPSFGDGPQRVREFIQAVHILLDAVLNYRLTGGELTAIHLIFADLLQPAEPYDPATRGFDEPSVHDPFKHIHTRLDFWVRTAARWFEAIAIATRTHVDPPSHYSFGDPDDVDWMALATRMRQIEIDVRLLDDDPHRMSYIAGLSPSDLGQLATLHNRIADFLEDVQNAGFMKVSRHNLELDRLSLGANVQP